MKYTYTVLPSICHCPPSLISQLSAGHRGITSTPAVVWANASPSKSTMVELHCSLSIVTVSNQPNVTMLWAHCVHSCVYVCVCVCICVCVCVCVCGGVWAKTTITHVRTYIHTHTSRPTYTPLRYDSGFRQPFCRHLATILRAVQYQHI